MFTFSELQAEVKRGAIRDKSGTEFDTAAKNAINRALYRLAREGNWRSLRRTDSITTRTTYSTGSGAVSATNNSANVTITGATLITDNVITGRRINISGSSKPFRISSITGETTLVLDQVYDGTTTTTGTYSILAQDTYNLPIQSNHRCYLWHEQFGEPYQLNYMTSQATHSLGLRNDTETIPTHYFMWEEDGAIVQPRQASIVSLVSSSASDTSQNFTIFGTVSGYPDFETLTSNGTTTVNGSKQFTNIDRIVGTSSARTGRVTFTANSGGDTIAVLPVGATTREVKYSKITLRPLPSAVYPIFVWYYKIPFMLVNDGDVHELGEEFDSAIIILATALLKFETSQKEAKEWFGLYKDELKTLKKTNLDKIDWSPTLGRPSSSRFSSGTVHRNLSYSQIGSSGSFGPPVGGGR